MTTLVLPNSVAGAALPANYEAAKDALARCDRIDECKDWADKMAALASYAKQADDTTLHEIATRISARAIRRCGELLKTFQSPGGRPSETQAGAHPSYSQREAAAGAGMSVHQEKQAVRVANVPADDFEAAVEREHPATVTELAEIGKGSKPIVEPTGFMVATQAIGTIKELATFCAKHEAMFVAGGVKPYDVPKLRTNLTVVKDWLSTFAAQLGDDDDERSTVNGEVHRSGTPAGDTRHP